MVVLDIWGPNGLFLGSMWCSRTVLRSTHVVEQLSFSLFPSIPTFDFELSLGLFRIFGALLDCFCVHCGAQKLFCGTLM